MKWTRGTWREAVGSPHFAERTLSRTGQWSQILIEAAARSAPYGDGFTVSGNISGFASGHDSGTIRNVRCATGWRGNPLVFTKARRAVDK